VSPWREPVEHSKKGTSAFGGAHGEKPGPSVAGRGPKTAGPSQRLSTSTAQVRAVRLYDTTGPRGFAMGQDAR
jgi:hypothetical protein